MDDDHRRVSRKPWTRVTVRFSVIHPVARDFLLSNASASPSLSLPGDAAAQRGRVSPEGASAQGHGRHASTSGDRPGHPTAWGRAVWAEQRKPVPPGPGVGLPGVLRELDRKRGDGTNVTPAGLTCAERVHEPGRRVWPLPFSVLPRRPLPFSAHFGKQHA